MKEKNRKIGVVRESYSAGFPTAVIRYDEEIYLSSLVVVENGNEGHVLALVTDIWAEGGIFTPDTSAYHLDHLDKTGEHAKSGYKVVRLRPFARIKEGKLSGEQEHILVFPGATLTRVPFDQLVLQEIGMCIS